MSQTPNRLHFLREARAELVALEGSQRKAVAKALGRISRSPSSIGKPLGRHARVSSDLTGFRSTRVDKGNLRIVWLVTPTGDIEIAIITAIGPRSDEEVYALAARRRTRALDLRKIILDMLGDEKA